MEMYAQRDMTTYASTNGYLSIFDGSSDYSAVPMPTANLPNNTVAPFWDDLYIEAMASPQQGIFYQINSAQTAVTYEYYLARAGEDEIYHFTVAYNAIAAGEFLFTYYATGPPTDEGEYATVGIQGSESIAFLLCSTGYVANNSYS